MVNVGHFLVVEGCEQITKIMNCSLIMRMMRIRDVGHFKDECTIVEVAAGAKNIYTSAVVRSRAFPLELKWSIVFCYHF